MSLTLSARGKRILGFLFFLSCFFPEPNFRCELGKFANFASLDLIRLIEIGISERRNSIDVTHGQMADAQVWLSGRYEERILVSN